MKKQKDIFISYIVLIISALSLLCVFYLNASEHERINKLLKTSFLEHWSLEQEISRSLLILCANDKGIPDYQNFIPNTEGRFTPDLLKENSPNLLKKRGLQNNQNLCRNIKVQNGEVDKTRHESEADINELESNLHILQGINLVFLLLIPLTFAIWRTVIYIRLVHERKKLYIDLLTGAYNRRYLEQAIKEEKPDYLIMLDLDDFKKINDTYGHLTGDRILIAFTEMLRQFLRETDVIVRFGGDEFIIMLHNIKFEDAKALINRLRSGSHKSIIFDGGKKLDLPGFSAGLAKFRDSLEDTIKRADAYVYQIKKAGKNGLKAEQ